MQRLQDPCPHVLHQQTSLGHHLVPARVLPGGLPAGLAVRHGLVAPGTVILYHQEKCRSLILIEKLLFTRNVERYVTALPIHDELSVNFSLPEDEGCVTLQI